MTDFMYANKGGGGIFRKGQLGPIGQGTVGIDLVIDIFDLAQAPIDLTGYTTITGRMKKQDTGAVTAIDGTRTLVGTGSTGKFTWVVSANDSGTDGLFDVVFNLSNGTDTIVTLPGELLITNNPSVTASANNLLIGILQATSDWLDDEKTAIESADAGEILESDGTNSRGTNYLTATSLRKNNYTAVTAPGIGDDTADGYAPGSRWIDTVGDESYTCVDATLGAAIWKSATSAGIANIVEDTTPQLGGNLDLNGNVITGMVIGTDVQAYSAKTAAIAALTWAANNIILLTGTATASVQALAAHVVTFIQSASAGDARTAIGAAASADLSNYLPLVGGTMAGTLAMADNLITRPKFTDYGETVNAIGSIGGGSQDIDITLGNVVSGTVDTSTTTFTFSNPSASGTACSFTLFLTNGGSQTVNWPASVDWAGGTAPALTAAGVDVLTFVTLDGGTIWYGFAAGLDMS